nr:hypothetical protein [Nocardia wallacei]
MPPPLLGGALTYPPAGAETPPGAVAAHPAADDQVMTAEGSRIFLDQQAAAFLDDKILDAGVDGNGQSSFVLGTQGAPAAE